MDTPTFLAATGNSLARAEFTNGQWHVQHLFKNSRINCLAADSRTPHRVFAGTQTGGVYRSSDGGQSWTPVGLAGIPVKSLAVSPHAPNTLYAGCKPVSLFISHDAGESWKELPALRACRKWWWFSPAEPPDWRPYVQALALSPADPKIILAGMEIGGVLRSEDGGQSWKTVRGALLDCHSLMFHPTNGNWVYEGGGSGAGAAFSRDGGQTWQQPRAGLGKKYGWMVAADPVRPEVWYLSASELPNLLKGEFAPPAHMDGNVRAHIYRSVGGAAWEQLSGGLPVPLDYMAYALLPDPTAPGHLYAGFANGDVWHTTDYGDHWTQMPFNLGGIHRTLIMLKG
ncbi:MAG: hypothetical protein HUU38_07020 [Anaerolineales bacterium]|nr:hypothetical protein [Anaerolineales bacterium]